MADETLFERGRTALIAEQYSLARHCFDAFLEQHPNSSAGWFLSGATAHRMLDLGTAERAFSMASSLDSHHVQARIALADVCIALGKVADAVAACRQAVAINPSAQQSWFSLGVALEADGALAVALESYDRALLISPDFDDARKNRGALLLNLGRPEEAVENNRTLAAKIPFSYDAQFNLGESLLAAKQFPEAAKVLGRAVSLNPGNAKGLLHAGFALAQCERFTEAQQLLDQAAKLDQTQLKRYRQAIFGNEKGDTRCGAAHLDARALFLLRQYDQIERCDWSEREYFISRFSELIQESAVYPLTERALGFRAMTMGLDADLQLRLARQIASGVANENDGTSSRSLGASESSPQKRLTVAYISPDFRNHPTAMLAKALFAGHSRQNFEVIVYALGGNDGSKLRQEIVDDCDRFVDLDALDDCGAARLIAGDSVDILIDLVGYSDRSRPAILARRPAPIQISWLAYVTTTGAPWIDYFIGDRISIPDEASADFSEALIRIPQGLFLCSYAANTPLASAPERRPSGLPEAGIVLGAFHNSYKIDPHVFSVWMRFLVLRPDAVLWLLETKPEAKVNLRAEANARGIDSERLIFAPHLPHDEHLSRLQLVDLMLDTPQCNGGTTTADAFVAGVPVLTCMGKTLAQRMAASILSTANLESLITRNLEEYEALGLALLTDTGRLHGIRRELSNARASAPFFAPDRWIQSYEEALKHVWQMHCAGVPPTSFEARS